MGEKPPDDPAQTIALPEAQSEYIRAGRTIVSSLVAALVMLSFPARALTILSGPTFTPSTNARLAGVLSLTTDRDSRISVSVNDGVQQAWSKYFYDYGTVHSIPLLGFKPARTNQITVTAWDRSWNTVTAQQAPVFITAALPTNFPVITLLQSDPALMEPGYTLFRAWMNNLTAWYVIIVDSAGEVVWYDAAPSYVDVRQLENGDLFMPWITNFVEMNLLGDTVRTWPVPNNLAINDHDGVPTDHGTILYLSDQVETVSNYPTSMTDPNAPMATTNILYQKVVEISTTDAEVLNLWSPINELDPLRISYLVSPVNGAWDAEHSNAIIEDPSDDSLIVSMRNQNAVIKFSRATGQLRWILGPHENWGPAWQPYLLTPVGTPFVWQYGQHAPILTPQGTLILYDDGNSRASPFNPPVADSNNYSRAVEYSINEQTMEVSQVWDYGRTNAAEQLFTAYMGNAEPEPKTGNVLVDFSAVSFIDGGPPNTNWPNAVMARIQEVTHEQVPQIVFDLAVEMYDNPSSKTHDCDVYRSHRIADLYAHPALAVEDLSIKYLNGAVNLQFSADDARTYAIEASTNLVNWSVLGTPTEDEFKSGEFTYQDADSNETPARYYRVETH